MIAVVGIGLVAVNLLLTVTQPKATDAAMREWASLFGNAPKTGDDNG